MNKEFAIVGEIDDRTFGEVYSTMKKMVKTVQPVVITINSPGGDVYSGFAIYDLLRTSKVSIITVGMGMVGSMAAILLQAGDKRLITPNTKIVLHQGSLSAKGNLFDVNALVQDQLYSHTRYVQIIAKRSGTPELEIDRICSKETYLCAEEAKAWKLVDEIKQFRDIRQLSEKAGKNA